LPGRVVVVVDGKVVVVAEVVVTEVVVWDWMVVGVMRAVVVAGSSGMTPIKQYDLPATRLGQVTPGFNMLKSSTDSPHLHLAKSQRPRQGVRCLALRTGGLEATSHSPVVTDTLVTIILTKGPRRLAGRTARGARHPTACVVVDA
jgi:hypothetical protein